MRLPGSLFLVVTLMQFHSGVFAEQDVPAETSIEFHDAKILISASVILPVPKCAAFKLLTDYDSIPSYMPGVLATSHTYLDKGLAKVRQTGQVTLLVFHFDVTSLLEVREMPNESITFRQLEGNLGSYSGSWTLSEKNAVTRVSYRAELTFRHFMPVFLAKLLLHDEIKSRFAAIAREAARRNGSGQTHCD
jgi:hypothetical protein